VSPGGAAPLAHVSRAAVHKRIKEGKLTAFAFHVKERRLALFGKTKEIRKSPQVYVSVSEAKAWGEELEERAVRLGYISRQDLEGAKPDWHGKFWQWRSKFMRSQYRKHDEEISE